jgi:hypothetical protein
MTALQWIGLGVGLLIVVTRLPMVIWPGPIGDRISALFELTLVLTSVGVCLWVLAFAIALNVARPLSLLEGVMLVLAMLTAANGAVFLFHPAAVPGLAKQLSGEPLYMRVSAGVSVIFGCWLITLSLNA